MATGNISGGTTEQIFSLPAEIRTVKVVEVERKVEVPKFVEVEVLKPVLKDVIVQNPITKEVTVEVPKVVFKEEDITNFLKAEIRRAVDEVITSVKATIVTDVKMRLE